MKTGSKLCPLECTQEFTKIWSSDLVLNLTWPSPKLPLDFIEINFLKKFQQHYTFRVYL